MIHEQNGARKKAPIQFIDRITEICSIANESGILAMRFIDHGRGRKSWTGKSQEYLDHPSYGSSIRIGTKLKKFLDKFPIGNPNDGKPLLVLIVSDGSVFRSPKAI